MSQMIGCLLVRSAIRQHDMEQLRKALCCFSTVGLDLVSWQDAFDTILSLLEASPVEFSEEDLSESRGSAMALLRALAVNLPPGVIESQHLDAVLDGLREQVSKDRLSKECQSVLLRLKFDRELPAQLWEKALGILVEFFVDLPPQKSNIPRMSPLSVASHIRDLFLSADPGYEMVKRNWERVQPYLNWLSSQSEFFLLNELWEIHEAPDCSSSYKFWHWHKELVESGRISPEFGPEQLELAIELEKEGQRVYSWPEERWTGWEWSRDVQQHRALLDKSSPAIRAAAAFVLGRYYLGAHKTKRTKAVPPLGQILSFISDEERRGMGVAGAFLQGAMFGVEDFWKAYSGVDVREWMFQTLAVGPEPEFTGFQSLAFYAHEYLEDSEENLRRLVAIGREDAAILLATEQVNHDAAAEAVFRKTIERWRGE